MARHRHVVGAGGKAELVEFTPKDDEQAAVDQAKDMARRAERELRGKEVRAIEALKRRGLEATKDDPTAPQAVRDYWAALPKEEAAAAEEHRG